MITCVYNSWKFTSSYLRISMYGRRGFTLIHKETFIAGESSFGFTCIIHSMERIKVPQGTEENFIKDA